MPKFAFMPVVMILAAIVGCGGSDSFGIPMNELNGSGQSGNVILTSKAGGTEVVLSLASESMTSNPVHIHNGQCGPTLGGVAHELSNFSGGKSTTMLDGVTLNSLRTGSFAINAHNADDPSVYAA